jgi:hypothetical protein
MRVTLFPKFGVPVHPTRAGGAGSRPWRVVGDGVARVVGMLTLLYNVSLSLFLCYNRRQHQTMTLL